MALFDKYRTNSKIDEIREFLEHDLIISKQACGRKEETVERSLVKQLKERFGDYDVRNQCRVGDNFKMRCDVDLFNGTCGIELKLASSLEDKADEFQRAIGQIVCYAHEHYKETGVFLLVVGKDAEMSDKIKELKTIVSQIKRVHFIYKQAENKKS